MSELKPYIGPHQTDHILTEYYLKSEADKVIAELEDKCQMHDFFWEGCGFAKRGFKNAIAVSEAFDKLEAELRHHKYKRCLAMANYWGLVGACTHGLIQLKCMRREMKWRKLAEKFKPNKEADDGND